MSRPVILASQSIQRRELLASLGFDFDVLPADIDELAIDDIDHAVRVAKVALAKAQKISSQNPDSIVIAADTFIVLDGKRLEKPTTVKEARQMLHDISGRTVAVHTGWVYLDPANQTLINEASVDEVTFRTLSEAEIEKYVTTYSVTNWAGAFTLSHLPGMAMVSALHGSLTSVLGIPIELLVPHLKASGVLV